jgi:hypothetical protein
LGAADVIDRHVDAVEGEPIRWGRNDCAMWVAAVLRDLHGVDMGKGWRVRYRSEAGARRALNADGGLLKAVARAARRAGWRRIDPSKASPGDLGMFMTVEDGLACVVCLQGGDRPAWVGRIDRGVSYVLRSPRYAWRPSKCRP